MKYILNNLTIIFVVVSFFVLTQPVFGQDVSSGIATYIQINEKNVPDGSIVSFNQGGYKLSRNAYDPTAFAVVVKDPSLSLEDITQNQKDLYPVVSTGKVYVLVSNKNGEIKNGDLISSSETPGVGQKATSNGYIIGTALEGYNALKPGKILLSLNFGFNSKEANLRTNLLDNFKLAFAAPFLTPINSLRYLTAGLVVLISFLLGIGYFGRVTRAGVEAIGRNPLAKQAIMIHVIINLGLTLLTMGIGIFIAYLILIL